MVRPKGPFWEHVEETDRSWQCKFCDQSFSKLTRITRFKLHWSGVPGCGTTICDKVPEHVREAAFAAVDGPPEKKLKTTATSSNDGAHNTISTSLLEQNSQIGNVVTDVETEPELYFQSPGEQEFVQANMRNFQLDRVSSFPGDLIPGELVEQECERNTQDNLPLSGEDYRIEGMITAWNQLVVRGGSPERLTVNEDEPRGDSSQPGRLQCLGLQRNYDQQCSSSVNNDVNNDLCPSKKKHKATAGSSNNEVTDVISASVQEQNNKVMAQQGEALSAKEFEEWIASIPVEQLTLRHSSPEELLPNEFQTAPRTERAHQDCEGRTSDISSLFMEDNVISNSIENTTTATGLMQHYERGCSHERLSINQVETHGDSTHPADLPCLDLGIHYDQLCPSSLNNDVIMNDVEKMIRESGQLVVRGSSHEGPLVNCDEPQGDSSQPTDPLCLTHGRYHDQLCSPLVNMVGDPGQAGAGASSSGGLTCNTDAIKGDAVPTTKLVGQAFEDHEKTIWSSLMHDEVSTIGIYGMGGVGKTALVKHIYDQLQERRDSFCHVFWITVSQDTSISRLQNSIARRIGLDLSNEDEELYRASDLSKELMKKQKWVLILDDLWKAFELHKIGVPIQAVKGCKLILTTRSEKVCEQMDTQHRIKVSPLLEEEAWTLFLERLGHQMALSPEVEQIAKSITKECGGLPLGIKTMAGTMKGVKDIHEWRNALEDLRESRVRKDDMEPEVFHILRYSYNHLSEAALQQCFLYCALFPEDFKIRREDLIAYLIDEEVIKRLKSREAEFDKGHSMLNKLESACLLEGAEMYSGHSCVKMHDLIRDMAIQILQENSRGMVKAGAQLRELPSAEEWTDNLTRVSLMHNQIEKIPSGHSPRCPSLSTLLLCYNHRLRFIANSFFKQLRGLKVLDLSHTNITKLSDSVSELVSLTALLLIECRKIRHVPSLIKLRELKRLDLSGTWALEKMPQGMECLYNLRYLRMTGFGETEFPSWLLPKLSHLQVFELEEWIPSPTIYNNRERQYAPITVKGKEVACLMKLESLACHFKGYSDYVEYLKSRDETKSLSTYKILVGLLDKSYYDDDDDCRRKTIVWGNLSIDRDGDFQVMFSKDIQQLDIDNYDDATSLCDFWSLIKNATELEVINIRHCNNMESLVSSSSWFRSAPLPSPSYKGVLSGLKKFNCFGCKSMKKLFPLVLLPSLVNLEVIIVVDCEKMEEIIGGTRSDEEGVTGEESSSTDLKLPKLRELHLQNLPELKSICSAKLISDSIEVIRVFDCEKMEEIIGGTRSDEEGVMGEESSSRNELKLPKLGYLTLRGLPELKSICSAKLICDSIEVIEVANCEKMEKIIGGTRSDEEGVMGEESSSSSITDLKLTKLRSLTLIGLPELKSICSVKLICDSLKVIWIAKCEKLKRIPICLPVLENGEPSPPPSLGRIIACPEEWWESVVEWEHPNAKDVLRRFVLFME